MTAQQERLRSVAVSIRTKPTPLSDFIPLLTQTADHIDKLEAEIHASDLAVAEYRQQCLDNAQEIARLRAESEERLQNCVALAAENERLRKDEERKPMTDQDTLDLFNRVQLRMRFTDADARPFASGVASAEFFHGIK